MGKANSQVSPFPLSTLSSQFEVATHQIDVGEVISYLDPNRDQGQ